jgi:hypothetical protein
MIVEVHCTAIDDGPSHAEINFNKKLLASIFKLATTVKKLKAYAIEDWDYTPTLKTELDGKYEDWEGSVDTERLRVTEDNCAWAFYIKHTSTECETEDISLALLEECRKVLCCKKENLPLLMGRLEYEESKRLLEGRLGRNLMKLEAMEVGKYYHVGFLLGDDSENLILITKKDDFNEYNLSLLACTDHQTEWSIINENNAAYVSNIREVLIKDFPLYLGWYFKSDKFAELLKGASL